MKIILDYLEEVANSDYRKRAIKYNKLASNLTSSTVVTGILTAVLIYNYNTAEVINLKETSVIIFWAYMFLNTIIMSILEAYSNSNIEYTKLENESIKNNVKEARKQKWVCIIKK